MPKSRTSAALDVDAATTRLRELVVQGDLVPGQRLVERSLAERLGTSRIPVHEALRTLVAEGFAADRPTGGVVVREHSQQEVEELLEVSHALDALAARRIIESGTDVTPLQEAVEQARDAMCAGHLRTATEANARFHEVLVEIAPAPVVREILTSLRPRLAWLMTQHADPEAILREHEALVKALAARDEQRLEQLLGEHLGTSRDALRATS